MLRSDYDALDAGHTDEHQAESSVVGLQRELDLCDCRVCQLIPLLTEVQIEIQERFRYDGMSNLSSMEVYREETDQWELSTPLGSHEGGVGVGVIPIPPNMLSG